MATEHSPEVKFEIGHVLFIDIVGYSTLLINDQSGQIQKLKQSWLDATIDYPDEAVTEAKRAVELSKKDAFFVQSDSLVALAAVYAKLGRADDAVAVLYQLSATPSGWAICASDLKHDPDWDRIRNDPRFEKIVASLAPK